MTINEIISLGLSFIILAAFFYFQYFRYYRNNMRKLKVLKTLFPNDIKAYRLEDAKDTKEIRVDDCSPELKTLIGELNEYSRKNVGTTDFSITLIPQQFFL